MVKIFVGNIAEGVTNSDLREEFEKHGKVSECDVLGSYGFVHLEDEAEAEAAISALDKKNVKGQAINVEKSKSGGSGRKPPMSGPSGGMRSSFGGGGGFAPNDGPFSSKSARRQGCTKLHIANLADGITSNELRDLFERYGHVAECDIVEERKIAFVHIEDAAADAAILGLNGYNFKGVCLKVQMSKNQSKPMMDSGRPSGPNPFSGGYHPPPMGGNYGMGPPPMGGMIPTLHGRGPGRGGGVIPVRTARVPMPMSTYPPGPDPMSRYGSSPYSHPPAPAPAPHPPTHASTQGSDPSSRYGTNGDSYGEHNLPPPAKDRMELLDLLDRRRRLEALDPYERRLIACADPYSLPPPPPEYLRLLRERALVKARLPLPPTGNSASSTASASGVSSASTALARALIARRSEASTHTTSSLAIPSYSAGKISAPPVQYSDMYMRSSAAY